MSQAPRPALRRRHRRPSVSGRGAGHRARRRAISRVHLATDERGAPLPELSGAEPSHAIPSATVRSPFAARDGAARLWTLTRGSLRALRDAGPGEAGRRRRLRRLSDRSAVLAAALAPHPDPHPRAECRHRPGQPHARAARRRASPPAFRTSQLLDERCKRKLVHTGNPVRAAVLEAAAAPYSRSDRRAAPPARLRRQPGRACHVRHRAAGGRARSTAVAARRASRSSSRPAARIIERGRATPIATHRHRGGGRALLRRPAGSASREPSRRRRARGASTVAELARDRPARRSSCRCPHALDRTRPPTPACSPRRRRHGRHAARLHADDLAADLPAMLSDPAGLVTRRRGREAGREPDAAERLADLVERRC